MEKTADLRKHCHLVSQFVPNAIIGHLGSQEKEGSATDTIPSVRNDFVALMAVRAEGLSKWGSARVATADIVSPRGEEIDRFENVFGCIVDSVHSQGGDLLTMDNDQLLFSWSKGNGVDDMKDATKRAVFAASDIFSKVGKMSSKRYLKSVGVAISTGTVDIVFTGDHEAEKERLFYVVRGKAYDSVLRDVRDAREDELVVDKSTWDVMNLGFTFGTPKRTTPGRLSILLAAKELRKFKSDALYKRTEMYSPVAKMTPDQLEDSEGEMMYFVPLPILQTLSYEEPDQERWANDRRMEASVVRLRVSMGAKASTKQSTSDIHEVIMTVEKTIAFYGGEMLHAKLDGAELDLLVCFGLPRELHEDDAERAILATLKIRASLERFQTRATIATGPTFCGCVGRGNSKRYTILGQTLIRSRAMMDVLDSTKHAVLLDEPTFEEVRESGGELEIEAVAPIPKLGGDRKKFFVPYKGESGIGSLAWHSCAVKAFKSQLEHRREHWFRLTHENKAIDSSVVRTRLQRHANPASTTTLMSEIQKWIKIKKLPSNCFSVEGGLGHGKTEILRHTVAHVVKVTSNLQHGFIDADPLNANGRGELSTFASLVYDVFKRDGQESAADIEKRLGVLLKSSGPHYASLLPWLSILNPVFPVEFTCRNDDVKKFLRERDEESDQFGEMHELVESTQRVLLLAIVWALGNSKPLLLCIDDATDCDVRSLDLVRDILTGGADIINQYSMLNPGVTDFLINECTSSSKQKRKVCVVLSLHPFEDITDLLSPNMSTSFKSLFGEPGDSKNRFVRFKVPLLTESETATLFMKEVQGLFPKLKALEPASRKKLFDHSEGNPLFIREIAHEAMEAYKSNKDLLKAKGRFLSLDAMEPRDLDLPASLEMKLGVEIDHQHLAAQLILKTIAVADKPLTFSQIYHAFPLDHHKDELNLEIIHLIEQELLRDVTNRRVTKLSETSKEILFMKFWFTTEFLHHAIERRLLLEQSRDIKRSLDRFNVEENKVPDYIFDDHSCSTEWGGEWGAEEIWRRNSAKRERRSTKEGSTKEEAK